MFDCFKIFNSSLANGEYDKWLGDSGNASILDFKEYTELVLQSVALSQPNQFKTNLNI